MLLDVAARCIAEAHADRHLAVGQIELGQVLRHVAAGGDARGRAERFGGTPSSAARSGTGVITISGCTRLAEEVTFARPGIRASSRSTRLGDVCQQIRIVARQADLQLLAEATEAE